jgi:hypothetical protein
LFVGRCLCVRIMIAEPEAFARGVTSQRSPCIATQSLTRENMNEEANPNTSG